MKGFKNTTRTQYSMGGDVGGYAKGGMAKGAAKISKVMGEFKKGELHSGSKDGPKVTKPAQAKAIAMSEARKAGMKAPMKKNEGGKVGKMPPLGESVKSGNRMSKMTAAERLAMEARFGEKKRPSPADSAKSANRIAKEEAAEARHLGVFKEGGKVRKYAEGGPVEAVRNPRFMPIELPIELPIEPAMLPSRSQVSTEGMTPEQFLKFQYEQERAIHSDPSSPFHSMYFPKMKPPLMMEQPTPPSMQKIYEPRRPPMTPPPLQNLGQVLQRIQQRQRPGMDRVDPGFAIDRGGYDMTAPPAGMAPVDPNKAMMMKKGGRTAMPKGKR